MLSVQWTINGLPDETQEFLRLYVRDVVQVYGNELGCVLLYGSAVRGEFLPGRSNLNVMLLLSSYDVALLKKYHGIHNRWSKDLVVVPLFVTQADLNSAAYAFPLEYQEIQECHRLLWGHDPFVGFKVDHRHLASQILQGLRGNLLRLRQRLVEGGSTEEAIMILLPLSVTSLLPVLRGVQRILGRPVLSHGEPVLRDLEGYFEIDLTGHYEALLLKKGKISPGQKEVPRLMDRYIESMGQLLAAVEKRLGQA